MRVFKILDDYLRVFSKAKKIREDEERRKRSCGFAVTAIVYSFLMVAMAACGGFLLTFSESGLLYIFVLVIAVVLLIGTVLMFIGALLRVIAQLTINRTPMSWIALAVFIVAIGLSVFAVIYFLA